MSSLGQPLLFSDQVQFAQLSLTTVTPATADRVHALAQDMLHYSPEPSVIEKLADSARLLNRADEVAWISARYRVAFPDAYARWRASHAQAADGAMRREPGVDR
jgi:hypothetical protein